MTLGGDPPDGAEENGVGYRRPPTTTRFVKGQSGNLSGRPRGRRQEAPYEAVLGQMVTIREDGVERLVSAEEAFLLSLLRTAAPPRVRPSRGRARAHGSARRFVPRSVSRLVRGGRPVRRHRRYLEP